MEKIKNVQRVQRNDTGQWQLVSSLKNDIREAVFDFAVTNNVKLLEINMKLVLYKSTIYVMIVEYK